MVHIYNVMSAIKKEQNNANCSNMDGPRDHHTEWRKSGAERQMSNDITYMWSLKSKQKRSRVTDVEKKNLWLPGNKVLCLVAQPCLTLCSPMDCRPPDTSVHGDSSSKHTGVGCHALLQGAFQTQGSNAGILYSRQIPYHLRHQGSSGNRRGMINWETGIDIYTVLYRK